MSLFKKIAETLSGRSGSLRKMEEEAQLRRASKSKTNTLVQKSQEAIANTNSNRK